MESAPERVHISLAEIRSLKHSRTLGFYFVIPKSMRKPVRRLEEVAREVARYVQSTRSSKVDFLIYSDARWIPKIPNLANNPVYPGIPTDRTIRKLQKLLQRCSLQYS